MMLLVMFMTEAEKKKQRYALVVKSNELIQKRRFSLTVTEQRIVLFLISKIKPNDTELLEYEFDIKEFCDVCGIEYRQSLSQIKEIIKNLRDKSVWITRPDKVETTVSWIEKPLIYPDSRKIKIRLDADMMPYLVSLRDNFTKYELMAILALKSKFSLRLYELFKSYEYRGQYETSIQELKKLMLIDAEYPKNNDFKRYVIDKSLDEINRFTDIEVEYKSLKDGRTISGFSFTIQQKEDWDGEYHATQLYLNGVIPNRSKMDRELGKEVAELKNQISLWDKEE